MKNKTNFYEKIEIPWNFIKNYRVCLASWLEIIYNLWKNEDFRRLI